MRVGVAGICVALFALGLGLGAGSGLSASRHVAADIPLGSKCCVDARVTANYSAATKKVTVGFVTPAAHLRPIEVLVAGNLRSDNVPAAPFGSAILRSPPYPGDVADIVPPVTLDAMSTDFYVSVLFDCVPPRGATTDCAGYAILDDVWSTPVKVTVSNVTTTTGAAPRDAGPIDTGLVATYDPATKTVAVRSRIPGDKLCNYTTRFGYEVNAGGTVGNSASGFWIGSFNDSQCKWTSYTYDRVDLDFTRSVYVQSVYHCTSTAAAPPVSDCAGAGGGYYVTSTPVFVTLKSTTTTTTTTTVTTTTTTTMTKPPPACLNVAVTARYYPKKQQIWVAWQSEPQLTGYDLNFFLVYYGSGLKKGHVDWTQADWTKQRGGSVGRDTLHTATIAFRQWPRARKVFVDVEYMLVDERTAKSTYVRSCSYAIVAVPARR